MRQVEFLNEVMPFRDKLYRLAKRLLVSAEEAEDATQEVLLKLWAKKDSMGQYRSAEAVAMTMTKNFCLDRLKSKQATNLTLLHTNFTGHGPSLQREVETKDSVHWVQKIMQELPETQRMVLQMRDVEQYEYEEIAQILEMKPTAVRVALSRARKTVRDQLMKKHNYGTG
ncbi:RNA polymerase sigma factor [Maribacter sp. 2307ULW6-5]|uniref:RNA polymerase sigma factor n=1 Tax=Maribacter sp. 2307ULW6-5 TaxID=3386275 RepID=UPI0039BC3D5A